MEGMGFVIFLLLAVVIHLEPIENLIAPKAYLLYLVILPDDYLIIPAIYWLEMSYAYLHTKIRYIPL